MLEVLVGLYGEGGGAGDGEGRRQPGSVGMGLSGYDEGLDGLEGRQGGRGGGGGSVPLGYQGEELVEVEAEGGLVEVGAGVPGTLGSEHQAGDGRGDREVLHGPGGQVAVLAHSHMAVWWASASGTEERPSSRVSVSWELGVGPAWKSVSQSDGGGAAGCGGWGRGGKQGQGLRSVGGRGGGGGGGGSGPRRGGLPPAGQRGGRLR